MVRQATLGGIFLHQKGTPKIPDFTSTLCYLRGMCVLTTLRSAGEGGGACLETREQSLFTTANASIPQSIPLYLGEPRKRLTR